MKKSLVFGQSRLPYHCSSVNDSVSTICFEMSLSDKEWDDLKLLLDKAVSKFLGFSEPSLVTAALKCIDNGYDEKKTADKLQTFLDEKQAPMFAEKLFDVWGDYRSSSKSYKSKRKKDDYDEGRDDTRKKTKFTEEPSENEGPSPGQLTEEKIKEMMQNAQKMIQERKAQIMGTSKPAPPPTQAQKYMEDAKDKAQRANELQAQIQARLASMAGMPGLPAPMKGMPPVKVPEVKLPPEVHSRAQPMSQPTPLILDSEGRTIDAKTGQAVTLTHYAPTLKANIRAKRREQFKGLIDAPPEEISASKYFDPRVSIEQPQRQKRGFRFHEQGKFEQLAQRLRTKAQLDRLQSEISQAAKKTGIASAAKLATLAPKKELAAGEIPEIEWWDSYIVRTVNSYTDVGLGEELRARLEGITHLVEHPIQMKPPAEPEKEPIMPVFLTAAERKKLRRQNRQEAQKEIQEKIRLGLAPPLEPKVRMANLMRVLGSEAVQDPTKVEAHVRAQMAKRQKAHEEANAARKLTKEQRREKKINKIKEDTSLGVHVSVYRVNDLSNPAKKFKVETNANQLYMTGVVVLFKDCNIVVVEGGPKQQRKFRRLMLTRIKWAEDKQKKKKEDDEVEEGPATSNKCVLVWEGTTQQRAFGEMKFKVCPTEAFAREQFRKHNVESYWDLSFSGAVLETAGEEL
ncbi:U4/U6 small nuclear ribonucleoprotein Prp3-like isoform X1 [Dreissena polymorpha]|uniref:U4/U6 small nuclear ribonucleoprotein Prp3-like isoform X1 n=2 Tax=Dreissena polymorpha TaxID=45954 RepID=UPI00226507F3|nr:U4/U6 small nuclear ribonucleoprotein Prp3-like isoform X1 [Dreissena polymorpha]